MRRDCVRNDKKIVLEIMKLLIRNLINIIFPIECLGCKQEGEWLCKDCAKKIPINSETYCLSCNQTTNFGEYCEKCKINFKLNGVFIASDYNNELVKKLIKTLKYRFVPDVGRELSKLLIFFLQNQINKAQVSPPPQVLKNFSETIIMPVPLHQKRLKWRGFNQAEKLGLPVAEHFNLSVDTTNLQRARHTSSQAQLHAEQRKSNLLDSFVWQGENLQNKNIILIDDVATTGSTLEECAKILKPAGVGEVWGLVVAHG